MTQTHSPTVRRRRLSKALLQARLAVSMKADEVARALGWQPSKVTRIERNEWKLPSVGDVTDLMDLYGVTDEAKRKAMIALAREARQRGWWEEYKDVLGGALPEFEAEATEIRSFETLLVPGLLQTPEYAASVFRGGQVVDNALIERRVQARVERQRILERPDPPMLWAVIDEAALTKHVGGVSCMRDQLQHIIRMASQPNIGIQVLPDAVGAHASMSGAFTILEYATDDDPTLVYVETTTGDLFVEGAEAVRGYTLRYGHLGASALSADASERYLVDLVKQLK
jgi:transcriptional regulator with XRE-family HTH domain